MTSLSLVNLIFRDTLSADVFGPSSFVIVHADFTIELTYRPSLERSLIVSKWICNQFFRYHVHCTELIAWREVPRINVYRYIVRSAIWWQLKQFICVMRAWRVLYSHALAARVFAWRNTRIRVHAYTRAHLRTKQSYQLVPDYNLARASSRESRYQKYYSTCLASWTSESSRAGKRGKGVQQRWRRKHERPPPPPIRSDSISIDLISRSVAYLPTYPPTYLGR